MEQTITMKKISKTATLKWCWLSLLVIILDQWSKYLVVDKFELYESIPIFPLFNLTFLHNNGAAFGFLSQYPSVAVWLFSSITIIMSGILFVWLKNLPARNKWIACALSLVLGGGIGNLIDRIYYGYVIDFLDVYYDSAHFPAFNIADSAITVGAIIIFFNMFGKKRR
jgi:signal peptidase II